VISASETAHGPGKEATLIFPHQLFQDHPGLRTSHRIVLVEEGLIFGNDPVWPLRIHRQKLILHRASMRAYGEQIRADGYQLDYLDHGKTWEAHLLQMAPAKVLVADPLDDVLERRLRRAADTHGWQLEFLESPGFLTPAPFLEAHTGKLRKKPFMANFYKDQRKRMQILMDSRDQPIGGKWSFDEDNREKFPSNHFAPREPRTTASEHVAEAQHYIARHFPDALGLAGDFHYPVTRAEALDWLRRFLEERFEDFGRYEDALSREHRVLFHSVLTPVLNLGLLTPAEIVEEALTHGQTHGIPLNSLEGFVRQVIGWREFVAGIYRHRGVEIRRGNYWHHTSPMPRAFYTAETGIPPVDDAIRRVLKHGWCHHIERLMVLGSFMLLCRIHPDAVYRWFMELFVDAYDWVMVPNVYGMSQFADGGTFTTKPYLCGSNYIRKMSDYPKGAWCEVWDGLYWSFIADHLDFFGKNPRLSMMARSWEKMADAKKQHHRKVTQNYLESLDLLRS
jgi:deoxyribodipyrimidine photolyase-related protein